MEALYTHQKHIINRASKGSLALFCEMGTGKTRAILESLNQERLPCLIVCPASVTGVWQREIAKWLSTSFTTLDGTKTKRWSQITKQTSSLYIISYATLRQYNYTQFTRNTITGRRYRRYGNKLRDAVEWNCVILDESSKIKSYKTKQSQACFAFSNVPYRYMLSGTPITHSPLDIYSQFKFLKPELFRTWSEFQSRYAIVEKRPLPVGKSKRYTHYNHILGIQNEKELYQKIYPYAVNYKKKDCLDLPDKVYEQLEVKLTKEQRQSYDDLIKEYVTTLGSESVAASNILTRFLKLQQICQGFLLPGPDSITQKPLIFSSNPKLDTLEEVLETTKAHKVIVWCRFKQDLLNVSKLCHKLKLKNLMFAGETKHKSDVIETFQNNDNYRVFVAQIQTGGFGITLTAADYVVYYSQTFELGLRQQSEDRSHRIGVTNKVTYVDLLCKETVDESIAKNLKDKRSFQGHFDAERFQNWAKGVSDVKSNSYMGRSSETS